MRKTGVLPPMQRVSVAEYEGQEKALLEKYLDVNLLGGTANTSENRSARHCLGIGAPEAKGIFKATGASTLRELVRWYFDSAVSVEECEICNMELQGAIGSSKRTAQVIALVALCGKALDYPMAVIMEVLQF